MPKCCSDNCEDKSGFVFMIGGKYYCETHLTKEKDFEIYETRKQYQESIKDIIVSYSLALEVPINSEEA